MRQSQDLVLQFRARKLFPDAKLPEKGSAGAAGYDIFCAKETEILPWDAKLIPTGIAVAIPPGHYGRIASRSSVAHKLRCDVSAGVIDRDYRGEVLVLVRNHSPSSVKFALGSKIAQIILEKISCPPVVECTNLDETERGAKGFGSTGK